MLYQVEDFEGGYLVHNMTEYVQTPLMFLVDHITSAAPTAIRGGSTPISIIVFHGVNGMRFIDPLADFVLGFRLLQQARHEDCPWHVGHASSRSADHMSTPGDCQWHHRLAWIIMIAAIIDFIILDCYIHLLKGMLKVGICKSRLKPASACTLPRCRRFFRYTDLHGKVSLDTVKFVEDFRFYQADCCRSRHALV